MATTNDAAPATRRKSTPSGSRGPTDGQPEAGAAGRRNLPPGMIHLPENAARAVARLALAGIEPLLETEDWVLVLACSRREVEKLRSSGKLPPPDEHVGKMPRWRASTVRRWLEGQPA